MMKKRASLLISGITTAALVVTAIGSFAAWNTLTPSGQPDFNAKSGTPVTLSVAKGTDGFSGKTLVPSSSKSDVVNLTSDIDELTGEFTPTLVDSSNKAQIDVTISTIMGDANTETAEIAK
ncbi:MAG: hypothetical protein RSA60_08235, partial [Eubacterium sp.]